MLIMLCIFIFDIFVVQFPLQIFRLWKRAPRQHIICAFFYIHANYPLNSFYLHCTCHFSFVVVDGGGCGDRRQICDFFGICIFLFVFPFFFDLTTHNIYYEFGSKWILSCFAFTSLVQINWHSFFFSFILLRVFFSFVFKKKCVARLNNNNNIKMKREKNYHWTTKEKKMLYSI